MTTIPKELVRAFKKIERTERKRQQQQLAEQRAREIAELQEAAKREYLRRKRLERLTLCATVLFSLGIAYAVWRAEGDVIIATYNKTFGNGTAASAVDCEPGSKKAKCIEMEKQQVVESSWDAIMHSTGGKSPVFTLHEKKRVAGK